MEENESSFEAADLARGRSRVVHMDQVSQTDSHAQVQVNSFELEPVKTLVSVMVGQSSEDSVAEPTQPQPAPEVSGAVRRE